VALLEPPPTSTCDLAACTGGSNTIPTTYTKDAKRLLHKSKAKSPGFIQGSAVKARYSRQVPSLPASEKAQL